MGRRSGGIAPGVQGGALHELDFVQQVGVLFARDALHLQGGVHAGVVKPGRTPGRHAPLGLQPLPEHEDGHMLGPQEEFFWRCGLVAHEAKGCKSLGLFTGGGVMRVCFKNELATRQELRQPR